MRKQKYSYLKEIYPEVISLNQFYKLCRISKRGAVYLLENGIVPYIDTGGKTWKYKIKIDDVITFFCRREQVGRIIPRGALNNPRKYKYEYKKENYNCFSDLLKPSDEDKLRGYFEHIYADCKDVITASVAAEMIGLSVSTLLKTIKAGHIQAIYCERKYVVPKACLLEYIVTPRFLKTIGHSENFKKLLRGYEIWKSTK